MEIGSDFPPPSPTTVGEGGGGEGALLSYPKPMDSSRLKDSCVCGNTEPYLNCCGRFAALEPPEFGATRAWAGFRHALHELYMYLFPLRNLYQAYWERLNGEEASHQKLMSVPEYSRTVVANFFWDYSTQFSDARPILRAARDIEGKNVRMANDFRQWGLCPLWIYFVIEKEEGQGVLRMLGNGKIARVTHDGSLPRPGSYVAARLLPYRNDLCLHPSMLVFPQSLDEVAAEARLRGICDALGVKSGAALRPDIQCEAWREHGSRFLAWWRELSLGEIESKAPDSPADWDAWIQNPLPELNGQTPVQASNHEFGRRQLGRLLSGLIRQGRDVSDPKRRLGL